MDQSHFFVLCVSGKRLSFGAELSQEQGIANCQSSLPSCEMQRNFPFKLQLLKLTTTKQEGWAEYTSFYFCILFLLMYEESGRGRLDTWFNLAYYM